MTPKDSSPHAAPRAGASAEESRGCGPVIRADDGRTHQATLDDVWDALAMTAAAIIVLATLELSTSQDWAWGTIHFGASPLLLTLARGFGIAALFWTSWQVWRTRETTLHKRAEADADQMAGSPVVSCRPRGWDE